MSEPSSDIRHLTSALAAKDAEIADLRSANAAWQKSAGPNAERVVVLEREIARLKEIGTLSYTRAEIAEGKLQRAEAERDALRATLRGFAWEVRESEVLRDPALTGKSREFLTRIVSLAPSAPTEETPS